MSSLSQFFGGLNIATGGSLRVFNASTTQAIPASATYASYGVLGGGGAGSCLVGGAGGGFSYREQTISGPFTLCAIVGAEGGIQEPPPAPPSPCPSPGGTTTLCGIPGTGNICATGGCSGFLCAPTENFVGPGGAGFGGCINTCGGSPLTDFTGAGLQSTPLCVCSGGGGAGGLYGNGGGGGTRTNAPPTTLMNGGRGGGGGAPGGNGDANVQDGGGGGGGMGSGGGGGGGTSGCPTTCRSSGRPGGSGLVGRGGGGGHYHFGPQPISPQGFILSYEAAGNGEPGYTVQFNELGCFSLAKTFFAAAGGGGGGAAKGQNISPGGAGGAGGGGGAEGRGGFGGGGGGCARGGIGGGSGGTGLNTGDIQARGGQGIAAFEFWTS